MHLANIVKKGVYDYGLTGKNFFSTSKQIRCMLHTLSIRVLLLKMKNSKKVSFQARNVSGKP